MTDGPTHHGTPTAKTRRTRLVSALAIVAAATMFGASPAPAAPDSLTALPSAVEKVTYAALGDSYAAGLGGGGYDPTDLCVQSPNGYAAQLASDPGNVHVALRGCAGADTHEVLGQLAGLDKQTKFVTLTVGANDLSLDYVTAACLPGPSEACDEAIDSALFIAQNVLPGSLGVTLAAVRTVAPKADVVVTGYPRLLDPMVPNSGPINDGVDLVNGVIASAVAAAGPGFTYVDVTNAFAEHGVGSIDPWIVSPPSQQRSTRSTRTRSATRPTPTRSAQSGEHRASVSCSSCSTQLKTVWSDRTGRLSACWLDVRGHTQDHRNPSRTVRLSITDRASLRRLSALPICGRRVLPCSVERERRRTHPCD